MPGKLYAVECKDGVASACYNAIGLYGDENDLRERACSLNHYKACEEQKK